MHARYVLCKPLLPPASVRVIQAEAMHFGLKQVWSLALLMRSLQDSPAELLKEGKHQHTVQPHSPCLQLQCLQA